LRPWSGSKKASRGGRLHPAGGSGSRDRPLHETVRERSLPHLPDLVCASRAAFARLDAIAHEGGPSPEAERTSMPQEARPSLLGPRVIHGTSGAGICLVERITKSLADRRLPSGPVLACVRSRPC
jgi:hypothetical protein